MNNFVGNKLTCEQQQVIEVLRKHKDMLFNQYKKNKPEIFTKEAQAKFCEALSFVLAAERIRPTVIIGNVSVSNSDVFSYWVEANDMYIEPLAFPSFNEKEFESSDQYIESIFFPKANDRSLKYKVLARLKKQF